MKGKLDITLLRIRLLLRIILFLQVFVLVVVAFSNLAPNRDKIADCPATSSEFNSARTVVWKERVTREEISAMNPFETTIYLRSTK